MQQLCEGVHGDASFQFKKLFVVEIRAGCEESVSVELKYSRWSESIGLLQKQLTDALSLPAAVMWFSH